MEDKLKRTLFVVITEYLKSGSPVPSGSVSAAAGASPSSVRSRMSDLERDGYLKGLHTSSGRVPTAKAFRFYINELLEMSEDIFAKMEKLDAEYSAAAEGLDGSAMDIAAVFFRLSDNSEYKVIPHPGRAVFRKMILRLSGKNTVDGAIFASGGPVKRFSMDVADGVTQDFLDGVARSVNGSLAGIALADISADAGGCVGGLCGALRAEADFVSARAKEILDFSGAAESAGTDSASNLNKALDAVSALMGEDVTGQNEKK